MSSPVEKHHPSSPGFYHYRTQPVSSVALTGNSRHTAASSEQRQPQLQQQQEQQEESNGGNFKHASLSDGEEKEEKREEYDLLPGSGPGGVPQKYFNLTFENLFEEDNDTKIFRELFKCLGLAYKFFKLCLYHIFVIVLGIPLAVVWGIINGIAIFFLVWVWAPLLRLTVVTVYAVTPAVTVPIQAILAPLFDAIGRVFRQIRVRGDISGLGGSLARPSRQEHNA